jgi:YVTN family beta-propeller protein
VAFSPSGDLLAVSDATGGELAVLDVAGAEVVGRVSLRGEPRAVAWSPDGGRVYVAEWGASSVAEVDVEAGRVVRRLAVGRYPAGLAVGGEAVVVCCQGTGEVLGIDRASGKVGGRWPGGHQPTALAVAPDGRTALAGSLIPRGRGNDANNAATIARIDLVAGEVVGQLSLPPGGTVLRDIHVGFGGRWAYATHTVGRFTMPTTQLDRGWVSTNAVSIFDLEAGERHATILLDRPSEGAADPWGVVVGDEGRTLWATLSGVHELARVDLAGLRERLAGSGAGRRDPLRYEHGKPYNEIWQRIAADPRQRYDLVNNTGALHAAGLLTRRELPGKGPRGVDLSPDGSLVAVAGYFAQAVWLVDAQTGAVTRTVSLATGDESSDGQSIDASRRGEVAFHDGSHCFQGWLTCATCHPEGRADGLNWDLLNDGIGNLKNTRSLVLSHRTPPVMSRAVRSSYEVATAAGFRYILFRAPDERTLADVRAYLRSLEPQPSPYRTPAGELSASARAGRSLFEDERVGCSRCHSGELLTDLALYDVGTRGRLDRHDAFDNPTLRELWRTAPYLHDGSAATLREVLTTHNRDDRHGKTSHLTDEQIDALAAYLRSL